MSSSLGNLGHPSSPSQERVRQNYNNLYNTGSSSGHNLNSSGSGNLGYQPWNQSPGGNPSNNGIGVGSTLNESLTQSRPQYQPGYIMVRL